MKIVGAIGARSRVRRSHRCHSDRHRPRPRSTSPPRRSAVRRRLHPRRRALAGISTVIDAGVRSLGSDCVVVAPDNQRALLRSCRESRRGGGRGRRLPCRRRTGPWRLPAQGGRLPGSRLRLRRRGWRRGRGWWWGRAWSAGRWWSAAWPVEVTSSRRPWCRRRWCRRRWGRALLLRSSSRRRAAQRQPVLRRSK